MVEAPSFAAGGGKMGALLREHDWSKTPLGPLETWPQSLRTTVGLVLHSVVPIVLLWGEDGTMIFGLCRRPPPSSVRLQGEGRLA
jgi:hypothetical protein